MDHPSRHINDLLGSEIELMRLFIFPSLALASLFARKITPLYYSFYIKLLILISFLSLVRLFRSEHVRCSR